MRPPGLGQALCQHLIDGPQIGDVGHRILPRGVDDLASGPGVGKLDQAENRPESRIPHELRINRPADPYNEKRRVILELIRKNEPEGAPVA